MIIRSRTTAVVLISLLILVSVGVGFFLGVIVHSVVVKKKEDPKFWREAALKHLAKVQPSEAQQKVFERHVDAAVKDLTKLRQEAITDIWQIVDTAVVEIEKELTPEQRSVFEKIKPKDKDRPKDTP